MGFRFKKSIKLAPGVKINLNKKSTGFTFGGKGVHYTVNSKGKRTTSVGIPGTGLSYSSTSDGKSSKKKEYSENNFVNGTEVVENMKKKSKKKGCLPAIVISLVIFGIIGSCGTDSEETVTTTESSAVVEELFSEEVTTAPSTVPAIVIVSTTDTETTTNAATTEKETTTAKATTTKKETTTEKKTTTKKAETTKKEITTEEKTTKKVTTTKKKVVTTKKSSYVATDSRYILNTDSKKFHYPSCHSAAKISTENYAEFNGTRDEIMKKGYTPCGNCDP